MTINNYHIIHNHLYLSDLWHHCKELTHNGAFWAITALIGLALILISLGILVGNTPGNATVPLPHYGPYGLPIFPMGN